MKLVLKDGRRHVLRFDRGEETLEKLKNFCGDEGVRAGYFSGLGAVSETVLMHYDVDTRKYSEKVFVDKMEIANLVGNISWFEDGPYIHAHGCFSDAEMRTWAGHVKKMVVAATCEIFLIHLDGEIGREYSEDVGLNLLK